MTPGERNAQADTQSEFEPDRRRVLLSTASLLALSAVSRAAAQTPPSPPGEKMGPAAPPTLATPSTKPNILVIFGDDVGIANISAYSNGLMGYETPNIDRIAREGIKFQHYYGEQSCTAGRAAFLTASTAFAPASPRWASPARPWA
jgi:hypothetical protein